ncbi:uncharacterized protein LOC124255910 [Haliotis rubra]|uniref:uncharacterized protein LOC124255910 n=1 Tax=Haliotis rubra TaxID=36100 RepID=UPI001EE5CD50|nr:uncharacterized protein LOC124255910 [Haliotis rubra]
MMPLRRWAWSTCVTPSSSSTALDSTEATSHGSGAITPSMMPVTPSSSTPFKTHPSLTQTLYLEVTASTRPTSSRGRSLISRPQHKAAHITHSHSQENVVSSPINGCYFTNPSPSCLDSSKVVININRDLHKSMDDVFSAIKNMLDTRCPDVDYHCSQNLFRLQNADVQVELEICDGDVPGVQVRKLSGDSLQYSRLCHDLLSCMNN